MVPMISSVLKPGVTRLINPVAKLAARLGVTPNAITVIGAVGLISSAIFFYPREEFFWGTIAITLFALSDLFDGAIARISDKGASRWGGFLDSTIDRVTDSTIIICLVVPLVADNNPLAYLGLTTLVTGMLIPYIRAKAESFGIECAVGIAERTERLIIILVGAGLHGLGAPYALAISLWLLSILGCVTVVQRVMVVYKGLESA
jgi:CDP-diacylglycerol---glycerol-3-phosphate 3-phosphatidyltransferase